MAFWGIELKPGKPYVHRYDDERGRLHLSQATLGCGSTKKKAVVVCNVADKKPIYLCSLLPRKMETCSLNVEFEEYDEVTFSVEGPHNVHLSGFFYGEKPDFDGDESDDFDSYEEGGLEAEFDSGDDSDFDFDDEDDLTDNEMYPSSNMANTGVRIEEIVDDEKADDKNANPEQSKKDKQVSGNDDSSQRQIVLKSAGSVPVLESEDEDGFPVSSSAARDLKGKGNSEESIGKAKTGQVKRKKGTGDSKHSAKRKKNDSLFCDDLASKPANGSTSTPEVDAKKAKNKNIKDMQEADQEQTPASVEEKSKDKKNKNQEKTPGSKSATVSKPSHVKTLPNGLVIEELQMGKPNGKRADSGKKVSVRYIGKMKKNDKIFDSNVGKAPFKFRLGAGKVIKGWDVGLKGMRVGGKRRLTIPPAMGYGGQGAGAAIPPNSWLVFDVELLDVN